jgi:hypothetical protein
LFKIAILQGVSLWHFHVYMCHNLNWFILSIFPLSTLLLVILAGLKILYLFSYRKYITLFTFLISFFYPPFLLCDLP